MFTLIEIRDRLGRNPAVEALPGERLRAAVALVVYDGGTGPEVLFIERAEHERDPWSGQLGFPGGRVDPGDGGPRETAEREALEEVGMDLVEAEYLGRLDDLVGAHLPVLISCFVFGVRRHPTLTLDPNEVADAFWVPVEDLLDPKRQGIKTFPYRKETVTHPTIRLLASGRPLLWGITYRLLSRFLQVMERPL